ncbi:putative tape measure protein [Pseudomonas phage POR1]|uniref:Putative tape measure protein n=1 Tax=Pseudomonas phage POR1 TaxID=1718594 RepID=A0A0N9SI90_9CAUD|nr:putative tape measure protein [Pseudomonas phage POR1]
MIVRELITRLGFSNDFKEADRYERKLKKLREDADKAAGKAARESALQVARVARAEAAVARLRGSQFKAIQDVERREHALEAQRARSRERAEVHARRMARDTQRSQQQQQRFEAQQNSLRRREADAQSARANAQHRAEMRNAQLLGERYRAESRRKARDIETINNLQEAGRRRAVRGVQVQQHAEQRLSMQQQNNARRVMAHEERMAAFRARQSHMRRAEALRERNLRNVGSGPGVTGGLIGAAVGAGVGALGLSNAAHRIDEMVAVNTRMNMVFDPNTELSRNAELQRQAMATGVDKTVIGDMAYKSMRASKALGINNMTQDRVLKISEAIATDAAMSGSSTEATKAALIQLFQGIEANRFGGQEFNSVREQTPTIAYTLIKQLGLKDMGDLAKLAAQKGPGKGITGKMILEAFEREHADTAEKQKHIPMTFGRTMGQLSNMWNFFLLDMEKSAKLTGTFNKVLLQFAETVDKGIRQFITAIGGWDRATNLLIATVSGALIPLLLKLALTFAGWVGPLLLLAAPLALIFDSMLEFARKYPDEWKAATDKIRDAMGNLVESIMYAFGLRLRKFDPSRSQGFGSVDLENRGNGVVAYKGKEYKQDDAALASAIFKDNPALAAAADKNGGRVRLMQDGKLLTELQRMPGGDDKGGSAWPDVLNAIATNMQKAADWMNSDGKRLVDKFELLADRLIAIMQKLYSDAPVSANADTNRAWQDFKDGRPGDSLISLGKGLLRDSTDFFTSRTDGAGEPGKQPLYNPAAALTGMDASDFDPSGGRGGRTTVEKVEVINNFPETPKSPEQFASMVESGSAKVGRAISRGLNFTATENTGRPTK